MRNIASLKARPMSPARKRLVDAAAAARYTLRDLSAMLGRNPSYLQQYLAKESPRRLPLEVRRFLAPLLHIPESAMVDDEDEPAPVARVASRTPAPDEAAIPLVGERNLGAEPTRMLLSDILPLPPGARAIRLSAHRGILQPKTIIVVDPAALTRVGDLVALAEGEGGAQALAAVGMLVPAADGLAVQNGESVPVRPGAEVWRVCCIVPG